MRGALPGSDDLEPIQLGDRCPFCGKTWGDRSVCGPPVYDSWRTQNDKGRLFPGRQGLRRERTRAKRSPESRRAERARARERDVEKVRAGDRDRKRRQKQRLTGGDGPAIVGVL